MIGRPGEFAAMTSAECWDGWFALVPEGAKWENKVLARAFLTLPFYSPIRAARRINVPTLVIAGARDSVTPPQAARRACARIP